MSHSKVKNPGSSVICGKYTRAYRSVPFGDRVLDFFLAVYAGLLAHLGVPQPRTLKELQTILDSAGLALWRGCIPGSLGDHFVVNPYSIQAVAQAANEAKGDRSKFDWKIRRGVLDSMVGALCVSPVEIDEDIEGNRIPLEFQCQILDGAVADGMLPPNALVLSGDARPPALCAGYHSVAPGKSLHAHFGYLPLDPHNEAHKALRKEINDLLVAIFHSDPMVGNAGRLMRVGGTVAWHRGFSLSDVPRVQTLLSSHEQVYHAEEVRDSLLKVVDVRGIDVEATLQYQADQRKQRLAATRTSSPPGSQATQKGSTTNSPSRKKGRAHSSAIFLTDTRNEKGEFDLERQEVQLSNSSTATLIQDVVASLPSSGKARCHCPFHQDGSPSAFISVTEKGTPYLVCTSGCGTVWPQRTVEADLRQDLLGYEQNTPPPDQTAPSTDAEQSEHGNESAKTDDSKYFPALEPLIKENTKLVFLIGPPGVGKTYSEVELAEQYERVIGLTSRRSLVRGAAHRFGGAVHEDVNGPLVQERVWACINSALRIPDLSPDFRILKRDLLIIAEGEQTLANLYSSGMVGEQSGYIYERLRSIARSTGLVVIDDAFLSQESIDFYTRLCGVPEEQVQIITHGRPDSSQEIIKFESWEDAVNSAIQAITRKERCYIAVTSKAMAKKLSRKIKRLFPERNVRTYHSDIDEGTRRELENVNTVWADVDVVIASPTIASGVSFDLQDHFDRVYLLASSVKGITWSDLLQLIGRVRHPRLNMLCVWVAGTEYYDCLDRELVRERLLHFSERTKETTKLVGLRVEEDEEGQPVAHPLNAEHFEGFLDYQMVNRRRSNRVAQSLFAWWKHWGNPITPAPSLDKAVRKAIRKEFRELRDEIEGEEVQAVADAEDIPIEQARVIEDHGAKNQEEASAAEKARIKEFYGQVNEDLIALERKQHPSRKIRNRVNLALAVEGQEECLQRLDAYDIATGFDFNLRHTGLQTQVIKKIIEASPIPVESLVAGLQITEQETTEQEGGASPLSQQGEGAGDASGVAQHDDQQICCDGNQIEVSHNVPPHNVPLEKKKRQPDCAAAPSGTEQAIPSWSNARLIESGFVEKVEALNEEYNFKELLGIGLPIDFATNPAKFLGLILGRLGIKTTGREIRLDGGGRMRVYTVDWKHLEKMDQLSQRHNRLRRFLPVPDVYEPADVAEPGEANPGQEQSEQGFAGEEQMVLQPLAGGECVPPGSPRPV